LLEKQKNRAEYLTERADKKVIIFDIIVDLADQMACLAKQVRIKMQKKRNS